MAARGERDGRPIHYDEDQKNWVFDDTGEIVPPAPPVTRKQLEDAIPEDAIRIEFEDVGPDEKPPFDIQKMRIVVYKAAIVNAILKTLGIELENPE